MANPDRANGKAWKKKWGNNPPIEQSKKDSLFKSKSKKPIIKKKGK